MKDEMNEEAAGGSNRKNEISKIRGKGYGKQNQE